MNRITLSKQNYKYRDQKFSYTVVRSRRRKTSEIIVDEDQVLVRIPFTKSLTDVENLMQSKKDWIIRKRNEYQQRVPEIIKPSYLSGSTVPYLGKNYEIQMIVEGNSDKINIKNNKLIVKINSKLAFDSDYSGPLKSVYDQWIYKKASSIFQAKIDHFSKIINVKPKGILLKKLKNRWGSATKKGIINLNYNLIKAPEDIVDYVIIHELCHLRIEKHSHHFWNLLKKYESDYKRKVEWLEINGKNLVS
jgi:predicted metal-dependent hydrolase